MNWGDGNIDVDPFFMGPDSADYHLGFGSLCIDAGTNDPFGGLPATDFEGDPRIVDGGGGAVVDIGADEYVPPEASSYPYGDANMDGNITVSDYALTKNIYLGSATFVPSADANVDGLMTVSDYATAKNIYLGSVDF